MRISNNDEGNPLNTTFHRVDSVRIEPYSMTVRLTDKWPVTINYLEQWKTSPFAVMNEFSGGLRVADYPSDEYGNLVLSAADISEILDKDIVTMQFLKKSVCIDTGIYNRFGYCGLTVQVESGTQDGEIYEHIFYLSFKKDYSKRFSTDCFSDFFTEKALRSKVGIDDLREYATEKATFDELQAQNSYFVGDLMKGFFNDKEQ